MTNLSVFSFHSSEIRFIEGKAVANDVAKVLGYADPAATVTKKVFSRNKGVAKMETPGGIQSVTVLEEAGIYQLIFSSKLESAQEFQQWVFEDVLPSIRKTGSYQVEAQSQSVLPQNYLEALKALVVSEEQKILLEAKIEQDAPLVQFAESIKASDDAIDLNSYAKAIGTGRTRLFRVMRELEIIMRHTTLPYQRWIDAGYFEVSQEVTEDGRLHPYTLITGKGQLWLKPKINHHLFKEQQMSQLILQGVMI